uniref:Gastric cancer antigen Zg14 homolog n=1 Tax=Caligus rogercresseyi TaxID=217165 RepID=C1BQG5_CALRO|nr:Gastric cancer antigen Zg14 homolog [Caligus rogercresseyi]
MGSLSDYKVFIIQFDEESRSSHELFVKRHVSKGSEKKSLPSERTLLLSNLPPWVDKPSLKRLFTPNGSIQSLQFLKSLDSKIEKEEDEQSLIRGFKFGFIVFDLPSSLNRVLEEMDNTIRYILSTPTHSIQVGMEEWKRRYNESILADPEGTELAIKKWVAHYDKAQSAPPPAEEDEDGWVTVSRTSSKKPVVSKNASTKIKAREQRKRKRKELENFYKFQVKESKIKKLEELRTKFEADKQKQILLKGERKFKPT